MAEARKRDAQCWLLRDPDSHPTSKAGHTLPTPRQGNGILNHALLPLAVTHCLFMSNERFPIMVTRGSYNITVPLICLPGVSQPLPGVSQPLLASALTPLPAESVWEGTSAVRFLLFKKHSSSFFCNLFLRDCFAFFARIRQFTEGSG